MVRSRCVVGAKSMRGWCDSGSATIHSKTHKEFFEGIGAVTMVECELEMKCSKTIRSGY